MSTPASASLAESWLELSSGAMFWLQGRCAIGRHAANDLVLDASSVSRNHALLVNAAGDYIVSDLHSSNGTYVNGVPVTRATTLRDGDELRCGDAILRFRSTRSALLDPLSTVPDHTRRISDVRERAGWLLLADVAGYSKLIAAHGSKVALERFQRWIAGMRPLIERHQGHINSYVGDAIFAWWAADAAKPADVRATLAATEAWRAQSPVEFRIVLHHGTILFTRSERGEELSGQEVNFVFRAEKVAKHFGAPVMFSEAAVSSLGLAGKCRELGPAAVEGIGDRFLFFAPPTGAA